MINQQGYFEEYYPNFEFAQSVSQLNPEQFSGVVYDEASGRAVFAPPSQNRGQGGEQEDVTPEQILQQQVQIAHQREEEDFNKGFNRIQNDFARQDFDLIDLMNKDPMHADHYMRMREAVYATFQKEQMDLHTNKDLEVTTNRRKVEDVRTLWKNLDKQKNRLGDTLVRKAKMDSLQMGDLVDPYAVAQEEAKIRQQANQAVQPSVEQEAMQEIQKAAIKLPYLIQLQAAETKLKAELGVDVETFSRTDKIGLTKMIIDKIAPIDEEWQVFGISGDFFGFRQHRKVSALRKAFNELLPMMDWPYLSKAQKTWFVANFNAIAKTENEKNWKDITVQEVDDALKAETK